MSTNPFNTFDSLLTGGVNFLVKGVQCEKEILWSAENLLALSGRDKICCNFWKGPTNSDRRVPYYPFPQGNGNPTAETESFSVTFLYLRGVYTYFPTI